MAGGRSINRDEKEMSGVLLLCVFDNFNFNFIFLLISIWKNFSDLNHLWKVNHVVFVKSSHCCVLKIDYDNKLKHHYLTN